MRGKGSLYNTFGLYASRPLAVRPMLETAFILVLTTLPADADAGAFAASLVGDGLAACVNVLPPMESIYLWEGEIQREPERQVLIKTARGRASDLWERVRALHPYDVPEFLVLPIVDGSDAYLRWLGESTRPR